MGNTSLIYVLIIHQNPWTVMFPNSFEPAVRKCMRYRGAPPG